MKVDQQKIQQILSQTILALCNNGLEFDCELEVDGLLGITLDKKDVLLVKISEVIRGDKTALALSPNSRPLPKDSLELESHSDNSVNVPAKRLCTQSRTLTNRSPKRKKPEDDDDDASPQDLSQRTHSPSNVKQELFPDSRDSPAASVVRVASGDSNHSQWKNNHPQMEHDNDIQPLVFPRKHSPLTLKPIGVLTALPRSELSAAAAAVGKSTRMFPHPLPPTPPPHHLLLPHHTAPSRGTPTVAAAAAAVTALTNSGTRRRHKSSPDCLPSSSSRHTYAAKLDVNFRRETAKKVLTRAEEKFLVDWVFEKSRTKDGVTIKKVLSEVKSWLDAECRDTNYDDNLPNEEWFREFLRRHPELYAIKWWD